MRSRLDWHNATVDMTAMRSSHGRNLRIKMTTSLSCWARYSACVLFPHQNVARAERARRDAAS
jgi:hypothetical protein